VCDIELIVNDMTGVRRMQLAVHYQAHIVNKETLEIINRPTGAFHKTSFGLVKPAGTIPEICKILPGSIDHIQLDIMPFSERKNFTGSCAIKICSILITVRFGVIST
jgi:hypothetical protein